MDLTNLLQKLHDKIDKEAADKTKDRGISVFAAGDPDKRPKESFAELGKVVTKPQSGEVSTGK